MDVHVTNAEFHQNVGVPFLNALLSEIEAAFDMESIEPVQALLALDPSKIPTADDTSFLKYGSEKIKILFSFYGKERSGTYVGRTVTSPALLSCTEESLSLEYGGYKNMYLHQEKSKIVELETEETKITAQLSLAKANKRSTNKEIKWLEIELGNIKNRKEHPLSVNDILEDNLVSSAFPSIRYLLKLFVLVPMSEVVVERGFSNMKLTLTDKRTRLDNKSLDALMRMSYNNVTLVPEAVQQMVKT